MVALEADVQLGCSVIQLRLGWDSNRKQHRIPPPQTFPTHPGRGTHTAEELGIVASDCTAVCQRLGELGGF